MPPRAVRQIDPAGLPSEEQAGVLEVLSPRTVGAGGVASGEAFGRPDVQGGTAAAPPATTGGAGWLWYGPAWWDASQPAREQPQAKPPPRTLTAAAIPSEEAVGSPTVRMGVPPTPQPARTPPARRLLVPPGPTQQQLRARRRRRDEEALLLLLR